ncbi:MAG: hypothetical protein RLP44_18650 [Aggregatilineales bacterium]
MQSILRFSGVLVFAVALLTVNLGIVAQNAAEEGDPPITALISISSPDDNGLVTISGAAGAVSLRHESPSATCTPAISWL